MKRDEALKTIKSPYPVEDGIVDYVIKKLELSKDDFIDIMNAPNKSFLDYSSYYSLIQFFSWPIKIVCSFNILPMIFYYKYGVDHASKIKEYWENYNSNKIK